MALHLMKHCYTRLKKKVIYSMSLASPTLAAIQQAGAAVYAADAELKQATQTYAARVAAAMDEMRWDRDTLMAGKGVIIVDVLERYVNEMLEYDASNQDLTLLELEKDFLGQRRVDTGTGEVTVRIGGRADRVDMTGDAVRVVDYKTGAPKKEAVNPPQLFDEEKENRNDAFMQALLYCTLIRESHPGRLVLPAIYWVQQLTAPDFSPYAPVSGLDGTAADRQEWESFMTAFQSELDQTLGRIFSESENYIMTRFVRRCTYCPYRILCRR